MVDLYYFMLIVVDMISFKSIIFKKVIYYMH